VTGRLFPRKVRVRAAVREPENLRDEVFLSGFFREAFFDEDPCIVGLDGWRNIIADFSPVFSRASWISS